MIFSIKPQIFELKCVFSYFRLKTHITLLLPVYVHSWEQRKLGDVADIVGGGTPSTGNQSYWNGDIDWYAPAEIADQIYANSSQKKITGLGYENSSAKMLPPGTVLFTSRAGIGKTAILTRKGCTNQGFQSIVPHRGELDSYFIFSRTEELKRYGELVGAGSTFVEVSGKQMAVMELMMPPMMREQQTIGGFFQQLDHLITLHQCKCQIDGCRFQSPLAITWEQRKVTEIGKIYIGLVTTMTKHYTDEGTLLIRNSDIKDGKFEFGDNPIYLEKTFAEKNETRMHQIGDVITVHTGDVGTSAVITENEAKSIGFATIVTRPNPKIIDSNYLCSFLNTDKHKKWAVSISTGDGRTNYNLGDYFELVVPVPSIAEQKKIASYIQKLNRLITLHQCE